MENGVQFLPAYTVLWWMTWRWEGNAPLFSYLWCMLRVSQRNPPQISQRNKQFLTPLSRRQIMIDLSTNSQQAISNLPSPTLLILIIPSKSQKFELDPHVNLIAKNWRYSHILPRRPHRHDQIWSTFHHHPFPFSFHLSAPMIRYRPSDANQTVPLVTNFYWRFWKIYITFIPSYLIKFYRLFVWSFASGATLSLSPT